MVGPAIALNVLAGDVVRMEAWAKYTDSNWNASPTNGLGGALTGLLGLSPTGGNSETIYTNLSNVLGAGSTTGVFSESANSSEPDAFLQYLFFDTDSVFQQAGFIGVSTLAFNNWEYLTIEGDFTAAMDGFLYIYLANETDKDQYVYFDDLKITHESSLANFKVSQINDFYPFGMITANSWRNDAYIDPGLLYQSSYAQYDSLTGYYDFLSRSYDPQLGRFFAMDPAGQFSSPYMAMGNVPMLTVDEDGEFAFILIGALVGGVMNAATSDGPFLEAFATGALVGAASAVATAGVISLASGGAGAAATTASTGASKGISFAQAAGKGAFSGSAGFKSAWQGVSPIAKILGGGIGQGLGNGLSSWSNGNFFNNDWNQDWGLIGQNAFAGFVGGATQAGMADQFEHIMRNGPKPLRYGKIRTQFYVSNPNGPGINPMSIAGMAWRHVAAGGLSSAGYYAARDGNMDNFGTGLSEGFSSAATNFGLTYASAKMGAFGRAPVKSGNNVQHRGSEYHFFLNNALDRNSQHRAPYVNDYQLDYIDLFRRLIGVKKENDKFPHYSWPYSDKLEE